VDLSGVASHKSNVRTADLPCLNEKSGQVRTHDRGPHRSLEASDCLLLHGQREILEPTPDFGDMADAEPRKVICQQRGPVCREHGRHPHAAFRRRHGVGVIRELRARMLKQQQVADVAKLLTARVEHEYRVANRVPRSGKHRDAGKDFLVVYVEFPRCLCRSGCGP
jgi:hypothetical protein